MCCRTGIDGNGRLIAFIYPGDHPGPDGTTVFVDQALVDQSVNARLLVAGLVYPAFYATLPADLRTHLATVSQAARDAQPPAGLWPRSTAGLKGPATVADLAGLEQLVLWPKLFRRIVPYLASGFPDFDGFDAWLRADPVNRDDELFLLDKLERGNLHDVVRGIGPQIQLTVWPEDFIISPDPPAGGGGTGPGQVGVGEVLIVAALPDPVGTDRGHELVTLVNTTPAVIDLAGWTLADAAGGRQQLNGPLAAGGVVQVTAEGGLQLGNQGDTIVLVDPGGGSISGDL
jgi:hypothetical protein